jgi:predicted dehydrogenase
MIKRNTVTIRESFNVMHPDSKRTAILIGLGEAGETHLEVMVRIPAIAVMSAVDKAPRSEVLSQEKTFKLLNDNKIPLYNSLADVGQSQPDIVVIATPTPTHAKVCDDVTECFPEATILVEKPVADNLLDAQRLLGGTATVRPVQVALHMAYAPEVIWAANLVATKNSTLGNPLSVQSWSGDPHQLDFDSAEQTLGTSWLDSGINALSVIDRFAKLDSRTSLRRIGKPHQSVFEGTFICQSGANRLEAVVLTSWNVAGRSRSTRIRYSSGAEIVMDHHAVAGHVLNDGRVTEGFGSDGSVARRTSHYQRLYQSWIVDGRPVSSPETALRLHTLLLGSMDAG